jgi:hypothetical protein
MKKLTLMLICFVLVSVKGFSQQTQTIQPIEDSFFKKLSKKLEFGLKAGGNYSNFDKANFSTDYLAGFYAGATVAYKITDNFLIQEEFLYSQQGAKIKDGALGAQDLKLSYMTVPFLLKYRTNSGFYVEAGAQVGVKLKEEVSGYSGTDFAKKIDGSAVGGIGYQSKMGLGIGVRYVYGISEVGNFTSTAINNDFKNTNIQASLFFVF